MAENFEFELVSPERLLLSEPVEMVVIPGAEGDFGVLPGHSPMITGVRTGVISIYEGGNVNRRIFVAGGFAEVTTERCTVLAEQAVALEDADRASAEARIKQAEEALSAADTDSGRETAEAALDTTRALLAAVDAHGKG
jgi:F-type H+-transporting ATPase subunit epsilon